MVRAADASECSTFTSWVLFHQKYLVCVDPDRNSEGSGQPEVGDFDGTGFVDQQVLRLEISVEDAALVAEEDALENLVGVALDQHRVHQLSAGN